MHARARSLSEILKILKQSLEYNIFKAMTLGTLLAKASPARSGDELAGIAAESAEERVAAQVELAGTPLRRFLNEPLIPYESTKSRG